MVRCTATFQAITRGLAFATSLALFSEARAQTHVSGLHNGLDSNTLPLGIGAASVDLDPAVSVPQAVRQVPDTSAAGSTGARFEGRGNPLWRISLQSLSATRERPIFLPSRRPPSPPT